MREFAKRSRSVKRDACRSEVRTVSLKNTDDVAGDDGTRSATVLDFMYQTTETRDVCDVREPRSASRKFTRSGQMLDCMRRELLYSEKRPRDFMFAAIDGLLHEPGRDPTILSRLTRDATACARRRAADAGVEFGNWDTAGKAVMRAMLGAGAFLTPRGEVIPPGVEALATPVGSAREAFRDLTESFLLEFLIGRLGDVTVRDHTALAHALFRQFDPNVSMADQEDRVAILLGRLSERIELRGQTYALRGQTLV
jgi:hypothetical protein